MKQLFVNNFLNKLLILTIVAINLPNLILGASAPAGVPDGFPEFSTVTAYFFHKDKDKAIVPYKLDIKSSIKANPITGQKAWLDFKEDNITSRLRMLIMAYINKALNIKFEGDTPAFLELPKAKGTFYYSYVGKLEESTNLVDSLDSNGHIFTFINNLFNNIIETLLSAGGNNSEKILRLNLGLNIIERVAFAFFYDKDKNSIIENYEDRFKDFVVAQKASTGLIGSVVAMGKSVFSTDTLDLVIPAGNIFEQLKNVFGINKNTKILNDFVNGLKKTIYEIGAVAQDAKELAVKEAAQDKAKKQAEEAALAAAQAEEAAKKAEEKANKQAEILARHLAKQQKQKAALAKAKEEHENSAEIEALAEDAQNAIDGYNYASALEAHELKLAHQSAKAAELAAQKDAEDKSKEEELAAEVLAAQQAAVEAKAELSSGSDDFVTPPTSPKLQPVVQPIVPLVVVKPTPAPRVNLGVELINATVSLEVLSMEVATSGTEDAKLASVKNAGGQGIPGITAALAASKFKGGLKKTGNLPTQSENS